MGRFVTNKYLVTLLLALVMSMGGYIFKGNDKINDAQASTIVDLQRRMTANEIADAANHATQTSRYEEILRRLSRIEESFTTRRRVETP